MSLQDRLGGQNTLQLISLSAGLSLMTSGNPTFGYNFPLMLFGIVAHEMQSSAQPLTIFLSFTAFSALFDILGLLSGSIFSITGLVSLAVLLLKAPIFVSGQNTLRERGGEIRWPTPAGLQQGISGFSSGGFGGAGRGQTLGSDAEAGVHPGQTVWSMPGGFSDNAQGGHAASQGQPPRGPAPSQAKGGFPSSGGFRLGGDEDDEPSQGTGAPPPAPAPGRNGYSSIA